MKTCIASFSAEEKIAFTLDLFHRINVHHGIWFTETIKLFGHKDACRIVNIVYKQSYENQLKRLMNFYNTANNKCNSSDFLMSLTDEKKTELMKVLSVNWLANDGIWFQTIENLYSIDEAKICNDLSWSNFSPFEAESIKEFIVISPGLEGLKTALRFRMYAFINKQSVCNETETSFDLHIEECRVQSARKRKKLKDYPCKSAGIIEYTSFASAIDPNIKTQCIACPPDPHPEQYYCGWRFFI